MNDETKDDLMKRTREWLQSCVNAATRSGVPEEADLEAFILAHIDGEPARRAAAREEQREALGLSRWPVLVPFIAAMVRKLDANKPKKGGREGWQNDDPQALLACVREEVDELAHAVAVSPRVDILHEAADVANMAMMVADSEGAIRATPLDATPLADELRTLRAALERANEGVRYWTDLAQAEARDAAALRARVAELEAMLGARHRIATAECERAGDVVAALEKRAEKAEAQVAAARAKCESAMALFGSLYALDVLRAMDEATKK